MLPINKKGSRAVTFGVGLALLIIAAVVFLGIFGKLIGFAINVNLAVFLMIIAIALFIIIKLVVKTDEGATGDIRSLFFLIGPLGLLIFLLVTFKDTLLSFSIFQPYAISLEGLKSSSVGSINLGIPIYFILLIIGVIALYSYKKKGKRFKLL